MEFSSSSPARPPPTHPPPKKKETPKRQPKKKELENVKIKQRNYKSTTRISLEPPPAHPLKKGFSAQI